MIPERSLTLVNKLKTYSNAFSSDAHFILTQACKPKVERKCAGHDVTEERLKDLLAYIEYAATSNSCSNFTRFVDKGFRLLESNKEWAQVEQDLFFIEREHLLTRRGGTILSAIMNLAKTYFGNEKLVSPSRVAHGRSAIDISILYKYPVSWVIDYKRVFEDILSKPNGYRKYKSGIGYLISAYAAIRSEPIMVAHLEQLKLPIDALNDEKIYNLALNQVPHQYKSRLAKIRSAYDPNRYGAEAKHAGRTQHQLIAGDTAKGAFWIYELSPRWFDECQSYVSHVFKTSGIDAAISTITRLTKVSSAIVDHKDRITNLPLLAENGVSAFFANSQVTIKSISNIEEKRVTDCIGEICNVHNFVYGSKWKPIDLYKFAIRFECDSGDDAYRSIILDSLAARYPKLAQSIFDYAQYELKRIDGDQKSPDTIFGQIGMIKAVFANHLDLLDEADHSLLAEEGIAALGMNKCRILKRIRCALKDKYTQDQLELGSARGMQLILRQYCLHCDLPDVRAYTISGKKRQANDDKNKVSDYYSLGDVASIAYAIELGLSDTCISAKDELLLRLGRVLIKTGWNLSPVLNLEIDDILKLDAPLTGKTAHFVRLFKKRANYQTQFYEFELDEDGIENEGLVFGKEVTNALTDLEYIRDSISFKLRSSLADTSKMKYKLSLYRDDEGDIRTPTYVKFSAHLNEVLCRYECDIPFVVQRIRKGGLNYIYKTYAKKFKEYQKAGQHSLKVFLDVYLRDDGIKSETTIASATSVMADYFSGRPITGDITIVTEIPSDTKQTPTGRCASKGDDEEASAFQKQRQRLNKDSETSTGQCGDFNACLFCRHFRLVADAEHVHRLLSYHHYVVGEMERGISDYENTTDQAEYIDVLNRRVDEILVELSEINNDAVEMGKQLLNSKGCHEDWAFFANMGDMA